MSTRIRIKRGTESQITGYTGPHYEGELAYATNTGNVFVSDGTAFINIGGGGGATPTLQSVTDEGNTTTNAISAGTITANNELHLVDSAMRIFRSSNDMRFRTNNSDNMTVTSAGNVGIGTTAPAAKLDVRQSEDDLGLKIVGFDDENNSNLHLFVDRFGNNQIVSSEFLQINSEGSSRYRTAGYLRLEVGGVSNQLQLDYNYIKLTSGDTETMRITPGKVGIGTTAPLAKLHVKDANVLTTALANTSAVVEGFSQSILQIASHNTGYAQIAFGDQDDGFDGGFIYSNASRYLAIEAANAEQMRFTSNGNVGIGTTAPAVKLDVDGQVRLGPQSLAGFPSVDVGSNGRTTIRGSAPALSVRDANNNGGYIDVGGGTLANINSITSTATLSVTSTNVRFGGDIGARVNILGQNSSSQVPLGLKQGASGSSTLIEIKNSSNVATMGITSEGGFIFRDSNLIGRYRFDHDYAESPADGLTVGLDFRTENASGVLESLGYIDVTQDDISADESSMRLSVGETTPTEVMRLQSDGNVGIGTTAPTEKLHIVDATDPTFKIGDASNRNITLRGGTSSRTPNISSYSGLGLGGGDGAFHAFINNVGNVGIGTTAPSEKLEVNGNVKATRIISDIIRDGNNNGHLTTTIQNASNTNTTVGNPATANTITLGVKSSGAVTTQGNLGIGTTAPSSKVHINGAAMEQLRMETQGGPANAADAKGNIGDMAYDADFFYIKTSNGWGRVPLDFGF